MLHLDGLLSSSELSSLVVELRAKNDGHLPQGCAIFSRPSFSMIKETAATANCIRSHTAAMQIKTIEVCKSSAVVKQIQ
jgi:hypothetical protein